MGVVRDYHTRVCNPAKVGNPDQATASP